MGNPGGNRVITCTDVLACLEGDYSDWTRKWTITGLSDDWMNSEVIAYNETLDRVFISAPEKQTGTGPYFFVRKLSDGSAVSSIATNDYADPYSRRSYRRTITAKYFIYITGGVLHIYKDGIDTKQVDLTAAPLSWGSGDLMFASITWDGKYIFVEDWNNSEAALFEGS